MKIFVVGDYRTGTGPANVTKYYIDNLPEGTLYQKRVSKFARALELIFMISKADVILFSGYSRQNILGMKIAKRRGRKCAYLMHGCVEYENEINGVPDEAMNATERLTMELADRIIAVSGRFAKWLREHYPEHADKIVHVANGVDISLIRRTLLEEEAQALGRDPYKICTVGGGMPRKRIVRICEAIELLKSENSSDEIITNLRLEVVGDVGADTDAIRAFPFVKDRGIVPFEETEKMYRNSSLFIQNSSFETFGLAPIEALLCGCSVLLSNEIGALDIIGGLTDSDIIFDCEDIREIADKIKAILAAPNSDRLIDSTDPEQITWQKRAEELVQQLETL